jgi:hypothetical protein
VAESTLLRRACRTRSLTRRRWTRRLTRTQRVDGTAPCRSFTSPRSPSQRRCRQRSARGRQCSRQRGGVTSCWARCRLFAPPPARTSHRKLTTARKRRASQTRCGYDCTLWRCTHQGCVVGASVLKCSVLSMPTCSCRRGHCVPRAATLPPCLGQAEAQAPLPPVSPRHAQRQPTHLTFTEALWWFQPPRPAMHRFRLSTVLLVLAVAPRSSQRSALPPSPTRLLRERQRRACQACRWEGLRLRQCRDDTLRARRVLPPVSVLPTPVTPTALLAPAALAACQ